MHISYTGVQDAFSYALDDDGVPDQASCWTDLAMVVPLTLLFAIMALATAVATAAPALDASWFPVG